MRATLVLQVWVFIEPTDFWYPQYERLAYERPNCILNYLQILASTSLVQ